MNGRRLLINLIHSGIYECYYVCIVRALPMFIHKKKLARHLTIVRVLTSQAKHFPICHRRPF